jgi:hypothetical protein
MLFGVGGIIVLSMLCISTALVLSIALTLAHWRDTREQETQCRPNERGGNAERYNDDI